MLTTHLTLLLLAQASSLGEAGESCRTAADCAAPLTCTQKVCTLPTRTTASEPPPIPVRAAPAEPATVVTADAEPAQEPSPSQFSGVHVAAGVNAGAAPTHLVTVIYGGSYSNFQTSTTFIPVELRLALLLGRFEVALEGSPGATTVLAARTRRLFTAALSLGGFIKVYETASFGLFIPVRARGGFVSPDYLVPGFLVGATTGFGARFGRLLLEARAGFEYLELGTARSYVVPITATATFAF
jgi:hypothetical protein